MASFYWHDYETWGADPSRHRPAQFAGLRTDFELNEVGEPLVIECHPPGDDLPEPEACLITGLTPQRTAERGVSEAEFIAAIHAELAAPRTCGVGYNSLRFDDEVTRYTLYRNFHDPYAREWQNGNSRWDLLDVVRTCHALRPEGLQWPLREDGAPSFRLEDLSRANGLEHEQAHDALSDVRATLGLARLLRRHQRSLFDHLLALRNKHQVAKLVDPGQQRPLLHISGMFPASRGCASLVLPLAWHPQNRNAVICLDLAGDPRPLLELEGEALRQRVFGTAEERRDHPRLGLKLIHINRSPVVLTPRLLDAATARRLQQDLPAMERHFQWLQTELGDPAAAARVQQRLQQLYQPAEDRPARDVDAGLYQGFLPESDRSLLPQVRELALTDLSGRFPFRDERLTELLFRYRGHNAAALLGPAEQQRWADHCRQRIEARWGPGGQDYARRLEQLSAGASEADAAVLQALQQWLEQRRQQLALG